MYFENQKKNTETGFIDIGIPNTNAQLHAYYSIRKSIFCDEQGIFEHSDHDANDAFAIPIIAVNHYLGAPDDVIGVVRIYEENKRKWFGGRLGVIKEYRSFSKYIFPRLFKEKDISTRYQTSIAAGLIYRAVSLANYLGCDTFSAHVQEQNVMLFKHLHWNVIKETEIHDVKHYVMEADLNAYPATAVYTSSVAETTLFRQLSKVA